jgi:hypothetical protein
MRTIDQSGNQQCAQPKEGKAKKKRKRRFCRDLSKEEKVMSGRERLLPWLTANEPRDSQ